MRGFQTSGDLSLGLVDVVSNNATEDTTGDTTDNRTLDLVAACNRTKDRTRCGADSGVTPGVLYDDRATRGSRIDRPATRRRTSRRACPADRRGRSHRSPRSGVYRLTADVAYRSQSLRLRGALS